MYLSTIKWGQGTREISHESLPAHLSWLTMLYDATGETPEVTDSNGNQIVIKYSSRGIACLA